MRIPSANELKRGSEEFQRHIRRDAMYKTATFLVEHFWNQPSEMADSLGVLLLTWNQALYRYGGFDFDSLERCIAANIKALKRYRARSIFDYSATDEPGIRQLFVAFLKALEVADGSKAGSQSPVAVAKALHLLAPNFFPLWDRRIALEYGCNYSNKPVDKYLRFMGISQRMALNLQTVTGHSTTGKTLLKVIDEYNYAKYTKSWV